MNQYHRAGQTNHERAVARKERDRAKRAERQTILDRLHAIVASPASSTAEVLKAVELLSIWEGV